MVEAPQLNTHSTPNNLILNIQTDEIVITKDKLKVLLLENRDVIYDQSKWQTPFSIFITCLITLLTCDFKKALGFEGYHWSSLFMLVMGISFFFSCHSLYKLYKFRGNSNDMNYLINKIANHNI